MRFYWQNSRPAGSAPGLIVETVSNRAYPAVEKGRETAHPADVGIYCTTP